MLVVSPSLYGVGLAVALRPGCALTYDGGMSAGRLEIILVHVILWCHDVLWGSPMFGSGMVDRVWFSTYVVYM